MSERLLIVIGLTLNILGLSILILVWILAIAEKINMKTGIAGVVIGAGLMFSSLFVRIHTMNLYPESAPPPPSCETYQNWRVADLPVRCLDELTNPNKRKEDV